MIVRVRHHALLAVAAPRAFASAPPVAGYVATPADVAAARDARARGTWQTDEMLKRSPDSAAMLDYWDLTDAIVDGADAVRAGGDRWLPKFNDEDQREYKFRLKLTKMTNVYRDIIEGLASKPFEQEVSLLGDEAKPVPQQLLDIIENIDGSGNNLTVFSYATFFNGINSAVDWIFVDCSKINPNIRTIADMKQTGIRPYWSHVLARNILAVQSEIINGKEVLTYIKIFEPGAPDHVREFKRLPNGQIVWSLYEKQATTDTSGKTQFVEIDNGIITIDQIPLVPFVTARRDGRSWRFFPAMRDAADLQIELYQQESGLKFAKTLTAYPMLAANGIKPLTEPDGTIKRIAVGPSRVLYGPPDGNGNSGSWNYIEPNANSLKFLADDIDETIKQLRELGRQPLVATMGTTVIQAGMAASKAKSAVKAWGLALKDTLENALVITCKFMGILPAQYDPTVNVYLEFDEFTEGKDLDSLDADRDRGDISQETLWEEKKRRGVYGPEFTPERERERLLAETPADGIDTNVDDLTQGNQ